MGSDRTLARWSTVLLWLAGLTLVRALVEPVVDLADDGRIVLLNDGAVWTTTLSELPRAERAAFLAIVLLPHAVWIYAVVQMARLARFYRRGVLFDAAVSGAFLRLGGALAAMGVLQSAILPAVAHLFHARGITPWLADIPLVSVVEVDLVMAGAFFFILGKIMRRGAELQEADRLTV